MRLERNFAIHVCSWMELFSSIHISTLAGGYIYNGGTRGWDRGVTIQGMGDGNKHRNLVEDRG